MENTISRPATFADYLQGKAFKELVRLQDKQERIEWQNTKEELLENGIYIESITF